MSLEHLISRIRQEDPKQLLEEYFSIRNTYIDEIIGSNTFYTGAAVTFHENTKVFMRKILKIGEFVDIINDCEEYIDTIYWDVKSVIRVKAMIVSMEVYISFIGPFYGESYLRVEEYISLMQEYKNNKYEQKVPPKLAKKLQDLFDEFDRTASTYERTKAKYKYHTTIQQPHFH
jgi:hypothetical protein